MLGAVIVKVVREIGLWLVLDTVDVLLENMMGIRIIVQVKKIKLYIYKYLFLINFIRLSS